MKKIITLLVCLVCMAAFAQAKVLQKSDKLVPRWVKHVPVSYKTEYFAYRVVQVYVDNLSEMSEKSVDELVNYLPQEWGIRRGQASTITGDPKQGSQLMVIRDVYGSEAKAVRLRFKMIDSYWERVQVGYQNKYRCYVLYQVQNPNPQYECMNPVEVTHLTDKYGFASAISIIPGAGQMYKGEYLKGGLIMGGSVLCAGGIVLCMSNKAGYQALANKEHNAAKMKSYQNKANNWETGSYVCIGALAALWIYNIIDAGVSSGARRVVLDKYTNATVSFGMAPTMLDYQTPALSARITF